jgi:hypothetical protein
MATQHHTITVRAEEVEGLTEYLALRFEYAGDGLESADDRRAYVDYLRDLVEIDEALARANGEAVAFSTRVETLRSLIRDAGVDGAMRYGEALLNQGAHSESVEREARQGKGTLSLAQRYGLYEGVAV